MRGRAAEYRQLFGGLSMSVRFLAGAINLASVRYLGLNAQDDARSTQPVVA